MYISLKWLFIGGGALAILLPLGYVISCANGVNPFFGRRGGSL